jgi:hypothetical protein
MDIVGRKSVTTAVAAELVGEFLLARPALAGGASSSAHVTLALDVRVPLERALLGIKAEVGKVKGEASPLLE